MGFFMQNFGQIYHFLAILCLNFIGTSIIEVGPDLSLQAGSKKVWILKIEQELTEIEALYWLRDDRVQGCFPS